MSGGQLNATVIIRSPTLGPPRDGRRLSSRTASAAAASAAAIVIASESSPLSPANQLSILRTPGTRSSAS
jgi:hypothetical protein